MFSFASNPFIINDAEYIACGERSYLMEVKFPLFCIQNFNTCVSQIVTNVSHSLTEGEERKTSILRSVTYCTYMVTYCTYMLTYCTYMITYCTYILASCLRTCDKAFTCVNQKVRHTKAERELCSVFVLIIHRSLCGESMCFTGGRDNLSSSER